MKLQIKRQAFQLTQLRTLPTTGSCHRANETGGTERAEHDRIHT
jgi:hypothetical protein